MYRDFSEKSKLEMLNLVKQVENDKWSDFTDWVGDKWYAFEAWIGELNIKNYLNNVNEYHKKVIDKNNATADAINNIFSEVESVDRLYKLRLYMVRTNLMRWSRYIEQMCEIVNPINGRFMSDYMDKQLGFTLDSISQAETLISSIATQGDLNEVDVGPWKWILDIWGAGNAEKESLITEKLQEGKSIFEVLSDIMKIGGKQEKDDGMTLSSNILDYVSTLCDWFSAKEYTGIDGAKNYLSLVKDSLDMETGLYKYFDKTLHPYELKKLTDKYGTTMTGMTIISNLIGLATDGIDAYKVFIDPESSNCDKVAEGVELTGSLGDLIGKVYIALKENTKSLQIVGKHSGSSKAVNQILAEPQVAYTTSASTTSKVSKVLAVGAVGFSFLSKFIETTGEVQEDGTLDMGDMAEIAVSSSVTGLTSWLSQVTYGLSDSVFNLSENSDRITELLIGAVNTHGVDYVLSHDVSTAYVQNASFLGDCADNEENPLALRIGASVVAGVGMLEAMAIDVALDGISWVGDKLTFGLLSK